MIYTVMLRKYVVLLFAIPGWVAGQDRQSLLAEADEYYAHEGYARAALLYETQLKKNKNDVVILRKLAHCYASINAYVAAADTYKKLTDITGSTAADWASYGDMLKSTGLYEEAKLAYTRVSADSVKDISQRIAGCDSAVRWKADPLPDHTLQNMEKINTRMSDWGALYDPANTGNIIFVSAYERKEVMDPNAKLAPYPDNRTDEYFYNVYVLDSSRHDFISGLPPAFNRFRFHTGPVVFSNDQQTAYLTVNHTGNIAYEKSGKLLNGKRRLSLQVLHKNNGQWIPTHDFSYNQPASYSIGHAAISTDGKLLYFTSDMPGGYGKTDIWYAELKPDGTWDVPKNCGSVINTAEEDDFPTVNDADGIFFSSKGHTGMGGLDIFYAKGQKDSWQSPQNMRWPVNSEADDFYLVLKDKQEGLLSSNRSGGKGGDDIYVLLIAQPYAEPLPVLKTNRIITLEISVVNMRSNQPIEAAQVLLYNQTDGRTWLHATPKNGLVFQVIDTNHAYRVTANKAGHAGAEQQFNSSEYAYEDTIRVLLELSRVTSDQPLKTGIPVDREIELKNIHYDFDRWHIRRDAQPELDKLVALLSANPAMKVELGSHTDCRGTIAYNQWLSEKRAAEAANYIIRKGIDVSRIRSRGYGENTLVNHCDCEQGNDCTDEEHHRNRRTTFRILKSF